MLTQRPTDSIDPDATMRGKCPACGTAVVCTRSECQYRSEPGFGSYLCVGCPKVVTPGSAEGDTAVLCGTRVMMSEVRQ